MELDRTDLKILGLLSNNARISNKEVAFKVDLSPSSVHERIKRLHDSGAIKGSHADIDLDALGLSIRALLFIQMSEHEKTNLDRFTKEALLMPEVQAAWMISGRFDAIVELVASDTNSLHRVVIEKFSSREEIHRIETSIIFEGGKRTDLSQTLEL